MKIILLVPVLSHTAEIGKASIYADKFENRLMSNGQVFHQKNLTVASLTYPLGTRLKLTRVRSFYSKSVVVTVTDHGPYSKYNIDLSREVARRLGISLHEGWGYVLIEKVQ